MAPIIPSDLEGSTAPPNPVALGELQSRRSSSKLLIPDSLEEQVVFYRDQIAQEKAGKRKLFHSLVKIANELREMREVNLPLLEQQRFQERSWYEGGLWRAPAVLPTVQHQQKSVLKNVPAAASSTNNNNMTLNEQRTRVRMSAISLSDLFLSLVVITAFTRVGVAVSTQGYLTNASFLYFAVFWTIWSKEASYSTRFDTSDLSAQVTTLITCFAVLFASLSVQSPLESRDATRVMMAAGGVAVLHALLHIRVAWTTRQQTTPEFAEKDIIMDHVRAYAIFNLCMNLAEAFVWSLGIFVFSYNCRFRWLLFTLGVLLALRVPRAFLSSDFHAACSKRSVLFILLLGFLLQSVVVVASEFFAYQTPTLQDYAFVGAACFMFFCIKLLYVDESSGLATDHALLVNRWAGFFFNIGNFTLLLSTTIMGSGLNLLTHSYLAATAALPGPAKNLVAGGFSAVLLSTFFIKSMHLKRVPTNPQHRMLFIGAYLIQSFVLLAVVAMTAYMCTSRAQQQHGILQYLMQNDIYLLYFLSLSAMFVVMMSWLDEGVELSLYNSVEDSRAFRVHPFGFWWCLKAEIDDEDLEAANSSESQQQLSYTMSMRGSNSRLSGVGGLSGFSSRGSLSALSPLLGSSLADLKRDLSISGLYGMQYGSTTTQQQQQQQQGNNNNNYGSY